MLFAIATSENIHLKGADVSHDYLYGNIDATIVLEQPKDSSVNPAILDHAYKIRNPIYGARQAGVSNCARQQNYQLSSSMSLE